MKHKSKEQRQQEYQKKIEENIDSILKRLRQQLAEMILKDNADKFLKAHPKSK